MSDAVWCSLFSETQSQASQAGDNSTVFAAVVASFLCLWLAADQMKSDPASRWPRSAMQRLARTILLMKTLVGSLMAR